MTKGRLLVMLGIVAVTVAAGSTLYLMALPKTPLRAGYDRIRIGMSAKEVHAIMEEAGPFYPNIGKAKRGDPNWFEIYMSPDQGEVEEVADVFIAGERVTSKHFRHQKSWAANKLEEARERLGF
jgi:hypothetical protein